MSILTADCIGFSAEEMPEPTPRQRDWSWLNARNFIASSSRSAASTITYVTQRGAGAVTAAASETIRLAHGALPAGSDVSLKATAATEILAGLPVGLCLNRSKGASAASQTINMASAAFPDLSSKAAATTRNLASGAVTSLNKSAQIAKGAAEAVSSKSVIVKKASETVVNNVANKLNVSPQTVKIGIAVTAGAVFTPIIVPGVVTAFGFGSAGIAAGSPAAAFMASYGGAVPAGSACAVLQSIGAAGLSAAGHIITGGTGALACGGGSAALVSGGRKNTATKVGEAVGNESLTKEE